MQYFSYKKICHIKADYYKLKNENERECNDSANVAESVKTSGDDYVLTVSKTEGVDP